MKYFHLCKVFFFPFTTQEELCHHNQGKFFISVKFFLSPLQLKDSVMIIKVNFGYFCRLFKWSDVWYHQAKKKKKHKFGGVFSQSFNSLFKMSLEKLSYVQYCLKRRWPQILCNQNLTIFGGFICIKHFVAMSVNHAGKFRNQTQNKIWCKIELFMPHGCFSFFGQPVQMFCVDLTNAYKGSIWYFRVSWFFFLVCIVNVWCWYLVYLIDT